MTTVGTHGQSDDGFSTTQRENIKRVTIGFRPYDIENINRLAELTENQNNAHVVSLAISLARYFAEAVARGEEILIRNQDKEIERVSVPYLKRPR